MCIYCREIDLLQCLHLHSTRISTYPIGFFTVGILLTGGVGAIAQIQTYNPLYAIFVIVATSVIVYFGVLSGVGIGGDTFPDENSIPFSTSLANHYKRLKNTKGGDAAVADVLGTPIDVLREQNNLAKILDNDEWRRNVMRSSVTSSLASDEPDGPGIMMRAMHSKINTAPVEEGREELYSQYQKSKQESPPTAESFDALLRDLGLGELLGLITAAELDLETLRALAKHNAVVATNLLKDAGVTVPGHNAKIVAALLDIDRRN